MAMDVASHILRNIIIFNLHVFTIDIMSLSLSMELYIKEQYHKVLHDIAMLSRQYHESLRRQKRKRR